MTPVEYIKYIKRRCNCDKGLVYWKKEWKSRIRARGHWMNDYTQLLMNTSKYKTKHRYIAECELCGKFYFATEKRKEMIESLKFLNFGYKKRSIIKNDNKK